MIYTVLNPTEVILPLESLCREENARTQCCVTDPYFFIDSKPSDKSYQKKRN